MSCNSFDFDKHIKLLLYRLNHLIKWISWTLFVKWFCWKYEKSYVHDIDFIVIQQIDWMGMPSTFSVSLIEFLKKPLTEIILILGLYLIFACFNFISLIWLNHCWQASSRRIWCKSGTSSSLNSLLGLELLDTWPSWPLMILSKYFMVKIKPLMSEFEFHWWN